MGRPGRPRSSTRLRKEDCAALVIRTLPGLPRHSSPGAHAKLVLDGTIEGSRPFRTPLEIMRTKKGWRCLCPRCNRRSAVIYFPPDSNEPACRICLGLVYSSQYDKLPAWAKIMRYHMQRLGLRNGTSTVASTP
jgi:hypothetical protein